MVVSNAVAFVGLLGFGPVSVAVTISIPRLDPPVGPLDHVNSRVNDVAAIFALVLNAVTVFDRDKIAKSIQALTMAPIKKRILCKDSLHCHYKR